MDDHRDRTGQLHIRLAATVTEHTIKTDKIPAWSIKVDVRPHP